MPTLTEILSFNPTLVRLRPMTSPPNSTSLSPLFQSHAGSIEAGCGAYRVGGKISFQSHAGSIEAPGAGGGAKALTPCFNPTLVRLRHGVLALPASQGGGFQSHAGSIEAQNLPAVASYRYQVSIPRWFD